MPLPWSVDGPSAGFSSTGETWLPQPSWFREVAAEAQDGVPGSTLELYRELLRLRAELDLGRGDLEWIDLQSGVLAFRRGQVGVISNLSTTDVGLPDDVDVLVYSDRLGEGDRPTKTVGPDCTVWFRLNDVG